MNRKRLRTAATLASGGMAALALAGCHANGASPVSASSPSRTVAAAGSAPSAEHHTGKSGTTDDTRSTGDGGTPGCMAGQLRADLQIQTSNSEAKGVGTLALTNRSHESCRLPGGWAPIGGGGANDYTTLHATLTGYPDNGGALTLHAGGKAYAAMRWHTAPGCGNTSGLGVAWHSSWIPVRYHALNGRKAPICDNLVLGTLQPKAVNFT